MSTTLQRPTRTGLLAGVLLGVIMVLVVWAAPRFDIDPLVAFLAVFLTFGLLVVILFILIRVPIRVTAESSTVFPGTPEQLFEYGSDINLTLQVNPNRGTLLSQTGQPGQPESSYVTKESGVVWTTTVVSSDPPRKLVTTTTGSGIFRIDRERTYTPVAGGTLLEARVRGRMPLLSWLLRPVYKRKSDTEAARSNARIRDYLASVAATKSTVGN